VKEQKFSLTNRIKSFVYAFNGLSVLLREEHNFRIHLVATLVVFLAAIYFQLSTIESVLLVLTVGFVLVAEAFNSAIENIADFISSEKHEKIKRIKDIAAAAVFISALAALSIGLLIFVPKIIKL